VGDTLQLSLERDVADLEAVRARLGLERLLLVAHGWGAAIASQYVLAHPHRVSRLVLVSPVFPRAEHTWGFLVHPYESADSFGLVGLDSARMDRRETTDPVAFCRRFWGAYLSPTVVRDSFTLARLAPAICDAPPAALSQVEAVHRAIIRPLGSWDWREQLRSVVTPTLILQGQGTGPRDSSNAPVWRTSAREWAAIPNSGIVFLNAPVQFPWLRDEALFARLLGDFLRGGWPAGARAPHDRPSP
jgi:pimeloyl-ACP methyl ester carboxylesterase